MRKNKMLRIAFFGQKRMPSREGGVEIVAEELAVRMARDGYDVTCINRKGHHVSGQEFDSKQYNNYKGVKIITVPTIERMGFAAASSSFFATIKAAFGKYDVVHIHAEGPALFCVLPKVMGKKVIAHCHGLDWARPRWQNNWGAKYIKCGEKAMVKHADHIIVLSKSVQDYFKATYGRETVNIPNGVNRPIIKAANIIKSKWGLDKDTYVLLLARLTYEKQVHLLIKAFKSIKTDKKLVIAGGSSDSDAYIKKLHDLANDDDRILFTGFVQGECLEELYSNAYLYCLPSELEGMPLSLLEAMSYGNCCLTADIPECVEVIGNNGVTFEKNNIMSLKDKLQKLCDNPELVKSYRLNASDYVCNKYNWDDTTRRVLELYNI